jgi:GNAT superfamily N-acetyltransferase
VDGAGSLTPAKRGADQAATSAGREGPGAAGSSLPGDRVRDPYLLTCEPDRVDLDQVHAWLSKESYWAAGRERDVVQRSIAGSRPYSVHAGDAQVAFARVVTDGVTFAWICDVFVEARHRGRGLGSWIVNSIVEDLSGHAGPRFVLATKDAHDVYRRCWMELDLRPAHRAAG